MKDVKNPWEGRTFCYNKKGERIIPEETVITYEPYYHWLRGVIEERMRYADGD